MRPRLAPETEERDAAADKLWLRVDHDQRPGSETTLAGLGRDLLLPCQARRLRVKLIFWDGTGLCLFAKRLEGSKFRWPRIADGVVRLSAAQLAALISPALPR